MHQRADAERIAAGDHALGGQADQRIGALDLLQRVDEAVEQGAVAGGRDEVDDDLGVAGRLEDRAAPVRARGAASSRWKYCRYGRWRSRPRRDRRRAAGRCAAPSRRWSNSGHGRSRRWPGSAADDFVAVEIAGDMADARGGCGTRWPSKLVMPAASWPRCCRAWRPSAATAAAVSAPHMPNMPHSSRSLSSSKGLVVSIVLPVLVRP